MKRIKKFVKCIIGFYLILKLQKQLFLLQKNSEIIFFFPYYHTGGAEKVHAGIVAALKSKNCSVVFTKGSATSSMLALFSKHATIIELNPILSKKSKFLNKLLKKQLVKTINRSKTLQYVFGANAAYFYELLPLLNPNLKKIDLFHAFSENDGRENIVVSSAPFINTRIVINVTAKKIIESYYFKTNQLSFMERITIISNGVDVPKTIVFKETETLKISFIGRWSDEKRPELFLKAAKILTERFDGIAFFIAGSGMNPNKRLIESHNVVCLGDIHDEKKLTELYSKTHLLVLTSVYEGFPMVFMEGMSYGCIPITTNVGGINEHINHGVNGFLINETEELKIIDNLIQTISYIHSNKNRITLISENCSAYANDKFGIDHFNKAYQQVLI